MRILLVDNDKFVRQGLHNMLQQISMNSHEIYEAKNSNEGIDLITKFNPELVFLDIELDEGTGFDLLNQLAQFDFQLVFITAHNKYAIDAFRYSAIDFLLKPIDPDDLAEALNRASKNIKQNKLQEQLEILNSKINNQKSDDKKIALRDIESIYIVKVSDILHCTAEGSYTRVFFRNQNPILLSKTLKDIEDMLEPHQFIRCHHSHLINGQAIVRFDKTNGGSVFLNNGSEIPVSFRKKEQIIQYLSQL